MAEIVILTRDMSADELRRAHAGFDENTVANNVEIQTWDRFGTVALDGEMFVGVASGLAYKNGPEYSGWFYLTDLFVEREYRQRGVGTALLQALESVIRSVGVKHIWTWTAGYEAPSFYSARGYQTFAELGAYYSDGSSRIALRKVL